MIPVVIFGTNEYSVQACRIIEQKYNREVESAGGEMLDVVAFICVQLSERVSAPDMSDRAVLNIENFVKLYRRGVLPAIIIPRDILVGQNMLVTELIKSGVKAEHIYLTQRLNRPLEKKEDILDFVNPYLSSGYLPYLEFHLADHCNLNCAACEHYSGLVKEKKFTDFECFSRDFKRFHELVGDLGVIRIMGGEPLLHPDIEKFIRLARSLYPDTAIYIVTNALLVKAMPESLFDTMRENRVHFYISYYLPLKDTMQSIVDHIKDRNVEVEVSLLLEKFRKRQLLEPHDHPEMTFYNCPQAHCNNLYEGKVAACFLPFTTKYFNEYFDRDIPCDGAIDIYDANVTGEVLVGRLLLPMKRCGYCDDCYTEMDWRVVSEPSTLDDWIQER